MSALCAPVHVHGRPVACFYATHGQVGGLFGDEESRILRPAMERARAEGIRVEGPFPADTFFARRAKEGEPGMTIAMYHDQGLIPAKMDGIGGAANVTLGLPFVRTSVDHGTGFDIVEKGVADATSMVEAMKVAVDLARER